MSLVVIRPPADQPEEHSRLDMVLQHALSDQTYQLITDADALFNVQGKSLLFAIALGKDGLNRGYFDLLSMLRRNPRLLDGCTAAILVDGCDALYTKSTATEFVFAANLAGCAFVGSPLVEGVGNLVNFRVQAMRLNTDLMGAYCAAAASLVQRLLPTGTADAPQHRPNILALHASSHHVSNTLSLWQTVKTQLEPLCNVTEIGLRNGTLVDCSGCPYTTCLHFGEKGDCFYGGVMRDEVYPAVRQANCLVMICPNYNDALSANLTAFINRLTALFRQTRFYDKSLFSIVVSGYSGSDIVARQLISALNMNKSFHLPPRFALIETANDPGEVMSLPNIEQKSTDFACTILSTLLHT